MNILFLIVNYKRPLCINMMLDSLITNHVFNHKVTVAIADNQYSEDTKTIITNWQSNFLSCNVPFFMDFLDDNIGKAAALNMLLAKYDNDFDCIVTMDNDLVFRDHWYFLLEHFLLSPYNFIGFGSKNYWWHIAERKNCPLIKQELLAQSRLIEIYQPAGICGAIMALKPQFLRAHPWSTEGGLYGQEDGRMCHETINRAVFHWEHDWLNVDPITRGSNPPEDLAHYDKKKLELVKNKVEFKKDWDI